MINLIAILIPIVAADALNPVLAAATIYALSTRRPYSRTFWLLFGWFTVYFAAGIGIAVGLEAVTNFLTNPRPVDFVIEAAVGVLLLWFAYRSAIVGEQDTRSKRAATRISQTGDKKGHDLGVGAALLLGAAINAIGLPFAVPYFAAIDQILKADLNVVAAVGVLAIYNSLYALPFLALAVLRLIYGQNADALFEKVNKFMEKASAVIMPVLLFLIGATLIVDAVWYFTRGEILINVG